MAAILSKLEAVNIVLKGIGEDPVASLSSGLPDAEQAESVLDETVRDILESGWQCNTETEVTISLDGDDKLPVPSTALKIDTTGTDADINVTQRGNFLYNLDDHTFVFERDVLVDITYLLEWDEIPYRLAYYIAWVACGRYQMREMGSVALEGWIKMEIEQAKAKLDASEDAADDANVLRDSASVALIVRRRNNLVGR